MESAEAWKSSFVDKRSAVSRSDLNVLPSMSLVCCEEPQSMRKLSGGENVNAAAELVRPLAEALLKNVNRYRRRRRRKKKEESGERC
jgi:hypothetical protein